MRRYFVLAFAIAALVGWAIQSNAAQTADVCPGFIADAIETVGNNCGSLARNNACYGYNTVTASFDQLPEPDYFTAPSDLADLFNLRTISTAPLRTTLNEWGITLLSIQANLPDALPGQNVIFMLAGDVEMESAVDPATLTDPDAEQTPMQAFYFRTGIAQTDCNEAPDTLIVQGPRGVQVDFNANGADIRIGSTVALRTLTVDPAYAAALKAQYGFTQDVVLVLELFVFDGEAILNPGTPNEVRVPQGYRALRCLSQPENLGIDGENNDTAVFGSCPWVDIRPATNSEIQEFAGYEGMVLNYPIILPEGTTIASAPTAVPTNPPPPTATGIPPATTAPTATATEGVPPTATSTTPVNVPPELILDLPPESVRRDEFTLDGSYDDPDDDTLLMTINWGDGSEPQEVILGGGEGGGVGSFARLVAGNFSIPHVYPTNGEFDVNVTLQDGALNQVTDAIKARVDPLTPIYLEIESGDGQGALPDTPYANPLVGKLLDEGGAPVIAYSILVEAINASTDAPCEGSECYVLTDADGLATVNATAGSTPGSALVTMAPVNSEDVITFNLTVSAPDNNAPTVDINTDQLEHQNGEIFTLDYNIIDPDGDLMSIAIYWGDSDTPEPRSDLPDGAYFSDHEFTAVGTLTITVVVSDGELTDSDQWVLDVMPLYPLTVTNSPLSGWTGEVVGGNVYPGTIRIYVTDSQNDPLLGEPIYGSRVESISPGTTLDSPGTGFADVTVTSDCQARSNIRIGAADPTAPFNEEDPIGRYRFTTISVIQSPPYNIYPQDGDGQTTFVGSTFAEPLTAYLEDYTETPVEGASVKFTIDSATAEFTTGGTEATVTTNSDGFAVSPTIRGGSAETFTVYAEYIFSECSYITFFNLTTENFPLPARGADGAESTDEAVPPESTAEVTDEPTAPEATDEVVLPPESTDEVIPPEGTEEVIVPVFPTPTYTATPTATSTLGNHSAPTATPAP